MLVGFLPGGARDHPFGVLDVGQRGAAMKTIIIKIGLLWLGFAVGALFGWIAARGIREER